MAQMLYILALQNCAALIYELIRLYVELALSDCLQIKNVEAQASRYEQHVATPGS
jgi:hypothetical protein